MAHKNGPKSFILLTSDQCKQNKTNTLAAFHNATKLQP